jgi:hypothetical protein
MKIIAVDNYARESVADRLVAENIKSEEEGNIMLDALRAKYSGTSTWYAIVPDAHKLWRGMEELI